MTPKASAAIKAAAGADAACTNSFIILSLYLSGWPYPETEMGHQRPMRHCHQSILKYDGHMKRLRETRYRERLACFGLSYAILAHL
jgi:hypothetical protein